jgi:hypothetical protein
MRFFGLIDIDNEYRYGSFRSPFVLGLEEIGDSFLFGDEVSTDLVKADLKKSLSVTEGRNKLECLLMENNQL